MENTVTKRKWYNWRLLIFAIIAMGIFIKFFVLDRKEKERVPLIVALELEKVAMKSEKEVEAVLGKGELDSYIRDETAGCEKCPKMLYQKGEIEIIFINEIADRIALKDLSDFDFEDRTILGLLNFRRVVEPTFQDKSVKRWDNYEKYTQIAAFSKDGNIDYILIKSKGN
jgi:hypothetical protein